MKYFNKSTLALAGLSLAMTGFSACSKDSANPNSTPEQQKAVESLQGNFQTEVTKELSIRVGGIGCLVHEMSVTENNMTIVQTAYDDVHCHGKAIGKITTEGSMEIKEELAIAPGARALNYRIAKISVTPLDASWTTLMGIDFSGPCNIKDTPIGQSHEVTGLDCGAFGRLPARDQVYFTSYWLDGTTLNFTLLPQESPSNVGSDTAPAPRNEDLKVKYYRK